MTLKEKILNKFPFTNTEYIREYEQIADDFAIGFKDWCMKISLGSGLENKSTKELLQIYKKEKLL